MIPRYSRPQMAAIWTPENRFRIWIEIEAHACDAMAEMGVIPKDAAKAIWAGGKKAMEALKADPQGNIAKIDAIERVTKHDITAFTTWLGEFVGPQSRFVHQGLTSSDILDTTFAIQLTQAADILLADIDKLLAALKKRALEHKNTLTIGRSHAVHAEPTTFGVKLAGHYAAFARNRARLVAARAEIATCAISGPVGTFANVDPKVEEHVAKKLGLAVEPVSTQVIPRDRHAAFFATLGVIASSAENLATEIRHLQRTEVREAEEYFSKGQKGSSAMPHKRNPVTCEQICGLARVVRSNAQAAFENVALWHERDISHSSVERVILPDSTILADYLLDKTTKLVDQLVVYPERMRRNLDLTRGLVFSGQLLLDLAAAGMLREAAYKVVQRHAMEAWENESDFRAAVEADPEITRVLTRQQIAESFSLERQLRNVDKIFARVFDDRQS